MGFYISEDDILHSHCRENLKSYSWLTCLYLPLFIPQFAVRFAVFIGQIIDVDWGEIRPKTRVI
jgi:hypothetical protein